jgi:hypothetical protein
MKRRLHLTVAPQVKRVAPKVARRRGKSLSVLVEEFILELDKQDRTLGYLPPRK